LWYGLAANDTMLYVAENSLLYPKDKLQWLAYPRNKHLLENHEDSLHRNVLLWFGNNYTISKQNGDTLHVFCAKFGRTNMTQKELYTTFGFYYQLYQANGLRKMTMHEPTLDKEQFKLGITDLYRRILDK